MDCIREYIVKKQLKELRPLCTDVCGIISQYLIHMPIQLCQVLAYKLMLLGNVKDLNQLNRYAKRMDKCKALWKHFDTLWDKFSAFLTSQEDKKVIEHWHYKLNI